MDIPVRKKTYATRSRTGCHECRQHHRKCDERRPVCGLCSKLGRDCTYGLRLNWGGRPFAKSTFGQYLTPRNENSAPVIPIQSPLPNSDNDASKPSGPFVYGTFTLASDSLVAYTPPSQGAIPSPNKRSGRANQDSGSPFIPRNLSILPNLSSESKSLFTYFNKLANHFSPHQSIKDEFCAAFMSMAVANSSVMASLLSISAAHQANTGLAHSTEKLAALNMAAVRQLRLDLCGPLTEPLVASTLLFCYYEIIAGRQKGSSWRLHLDGAAALFRHDTSGSWTVHSPDPRKTFLSRCFVSLVALANVSSRPPSKFLTKQALHVLGHEHPVSRIDDFTAYSTSFVYMMFEIGDLIRDKQQMLRQPENTNALSELATRSVNLIQRLISMISHTEGGRVEALHEYDLGDDKLPPGRKQDYYAINESYHQAAILQILLRVLEIPPWVREVQDIVQRILSILSTTLLQPGPSLGILLYFPIFSAGCGAVDMCDRSKVQVVLQHMVKMMGFANIQLGIQALEAIWTSWDHQTRITLPGHTWDTFIDTNIDIILY
ncbi:fungal-specific transcription factor domain-containing protein [Stachybotrys elegans]|uniref:Fungal-specific transcription factor domain-containing protein n=1 Tax=Stachybotrys elegans TaxID=80388 RepID=A0A8K0WSM6_9HYPO|nr:fungal-specific transcription factor domain-containing protein [Stachybotrys elegans]